jgi:hypothetical protein
MLRRDNKEDKKNKAQSGEPAKAQSKSPVAAQVKTAKKGQKDREEPSVLLVKVPSEYVFWCHDGSVFEDLEDLAEGLAAMSDDTYHYHCNEEKRDFANWIRDIIRDEELAEEVALANNRQLAARSVAARLSTLR